MQNVKCNLCGANETFLAAIQNDYRMVACRRCGLVYANPRPAPEALIALYNTYHQRNGKGAEAWGTLMEQNFREVSSLLNLRFPDKGRLLDIGCGCGYFLAICRARWHEVLGLDLDDEPLYNDMVDFLVARSHRGAEAKGVPAAEPAEGAPAAPAVPRKK